MLTDELVDVIFEMLMVDLPQDYVTDAYKFHNIIHFKLFDGNEFELIINKKTTSVKIIQDHENK